MLVRVVRAVLWCLCEAMVLKLQSCFPRPGEGANGAWRHGMRLALLVACTKRCFLLGHLRHPTRCSLTD